MSEGSAPRVAGTVRPKHQRVERNITKTSPNCSYHAGSCAGLCQWHPMAQLLKSRVYHHLARSTMRWVPLSSCTSRIPKQHSLDPPVRKQMCNMHRKFPMMFDNCSDQVFHPCCCSSATALSFQWCRISCQGLFHSMKFGGPTIIRSILRKTTSSV